MWCDVIRQSKRKRECEEQERKGESACTYAPWCPTMRSGSLCLSISMIMGSILAMTSKYDSPLYAVQCSAVSCVVMLRHIISYHIISHQITSCHHITSRDNTWHDIAWYDTTERERESSHLISPGIPVGEFINFPSNEFFWIRLFDFFIRHAVTCPCRVVIEK